MKTILITQRGAIDRNGKELKVDTQLKVEEIPPFLVGKCIEVGDTQKKMAALNSEGENEEMLKEAQKAVEEAEANARKAVEELEKAEEAKSDLISERDKMVEDHKKEVGDLSAKVEELEKALADSASKQSDKNQAKK